MNRYLNSTQPIKLASYYGYKNNWLKLVACWRGYIQLNIQKANVNTMQAIERERIVAPDWGLGESPDEDSVNVAVTVLPTTVKKM